MSKITITVESIQEIVAKAVAAVLAEQGILPQTTQAEAKTEPVTEPVNSDKAAAREAHQASNKEAAAWMRARGLVPAGQAWQAYKTGERNIAKLGRLNDADGHKAPTAKPETVTEVVPEAAPKPAAKKAAKKAAAPRKAPVTTVARQRDAKGHFLPKAAEPVAQEEEASVPEGAQVGFTERTLALMDSMQAQGFTEAQIVAAMKAAGVTA